MSKVEVIIFGSQQKKYKKIKNKNHHIVFDRERILNCDSNLQEGKGSELQLFFRTPGNLYISLLYNLNCIHYMQFLSERE